jgi:hypothetical protein
MRIKVNETPLLNHHPVPVSIPLHCLWVREGARLVGAISAAKGENFDLDP